MKVVNILDINSYKIGLSVKKLYNVAPIQDSMEIRY